VLPCRVSTGDAFRVLQRHLGLTEAESAVAYLVAFGLTVKELAARTDREPSTVKGHLEHICRKTRAANSREVAALVTAVMWWAVTHGAE
jgi:DNA-binding CsgD family transcriptional regulator